MAKAFSEDTAAEIEKARALLRKAQAHTATARSAINKLANGEDADELDPVDKANAYATIAIAECLVVGLTIAFAAIDEE